ncbi:hypothetical protein FNV43_RR02252 [Rhamnella rubrinervis]|uniref:Uncharacterized protein n=1 Tax=Rhamnella rubrinervis TaxID=2594499 RepID=A0A8K0MTK9_9ROSA|nr:hypothetical protein FNV43_RR02252 [Rhamnella rubrinervis]
MVRPHSELSFRGLGQPPRLDQSPPVGRSPRPWSDAVVRLSKLCPPLSIFGQAPGLSPISRLILAWPAWSEPRQSLVGLPNSQASPQLGPTPAGLVGLPVAWSGLLGFGGPSQGWSRPRRPGSSARLGGPLAQFGDLLLD